WKTILIVAGMVPLAEAMQKTGVASEFAHTLAQTIGQYGPLPTIAAFFLGTVLLTQILNGQVTALVMAPIAVATALTLGLSPRTLGVVVAIACSASFLTPLAHPVNLLTIGPAGYTAGDFFRVGIGLTALCFLVVLLGVGMLPGG